MKSYSPINDNKDLVTKEYVDASLEGKAQLVSPMFTGTPTAPTAVSGTNTKQIATTEFVNNVVIDIELSSTQPLSPSIGDYWYKIIT